MHRNSCTVGNHSVRHIRMRCWDGNLATICMKIEQFGYNCRKIECDKIELISIGVSMFCPGCGIGEERAVPFCRTCGTDLRAVRVSLEQPDIVMVKADEPRIEIGRAIANKIRDADRVQDLQDILPKIEKFLETP